MLLDEIIALLGDQNARLSDALLKTKILLHQIGKKELAEWVNHELNGYPPPCHSDLSQPHVTASLAS